MGKTRAQIAAEKAALAHAMQESAPALTAAEVERAVRESLEGAEAAVHEVRPWVPWVTVHWAVVVLRELEMYRENLPGGECWLMRC